MIKMENDDVILCRLCLEVVPMGYSLVKENIANTVKILSDIDISLNDNLPKLCCSKCIFNIYFVENLRMLIINADKKLRSLLLRDGNFDELMKPALAESLELNQPLEEHFVDVEIKEEKFIPVTVEINEECTDSLTEEYMMCKKEPIEINTCKKEKIDNVSSVDNLSEDQKFLNSIILKKNNEKPYLYHCTVCNVDFQGNKLYAAHKGKHLTKTCEICSVTTRRDNFDKHMQIHTLGQQICDICGSVHKSFQGLRTHLFHFHNAKKKLYTCDVCGEQFQRNARLTYHKRKIHTGFRPHQCESCGKRFFDSDTLKKHVKLIHLKLREYHCKYCQKNYTSSYALKVHTRQHTNETPFICEYCTEGFRQLVSLKTHLARYHKDKPSTSRVEEEKQVKEDGGSGDDEIASPV